MADAGADLELRFTADSSGLRPEIEGLRNELRELRSNLDRLTGDLKSNASATRELTAAQNQASKGAEAAAMAGDKFLASLKQQAETVGMTRTQLLQYKADQLGVGEAARASIERIEEQNRALRKNREEVAAVAQQLQALEDIQAKHAQAKFNSIMGINNGPSADNSARASAAAFEEHFAEQAKQARTMAELERRAISLREALDPLVGAQNRMAAAVRNADELLQKEKITLAEHGKYVDRLKSEYDRLERALSGRGLGLTGHQMQMLAIQIPDVVQQLLMGQPAWQVLLQQGGQGVQILGMGPNGMGGVLRAMMSPMGLAITGLGALAAAGATVAYAMHQGREEQIGFSRSLQVAGSVSGITERQIYQLSETIGRDLKKSAGSVREVELALIRTGKVSSETLGLMTEGAELYARAMGGKAVDAVEVFLPLLGDTTGAAMKLNERFHALTATQIEHIQTLQEQGQKTEAIKIAMEALVDPMRNQAENLGILEKSWKGWSLVIHDVWEALLNFGREPVKLGGIDQMDAKIAQLTERRDLLQKKKDMWESGNSGGRSRFTEDDADMLTALNSMIKQSNEIRANLKATQDEANEKKRLEGSLSGVIDAQYAGSAQLRMYKEQEAMLRRSLELKIGDAKVQAEAARALEQNLKNQANILKRQNGTTPKGRQDYVEPQTSKDEAGRRDAVDGLYNDRALEAERAFWTERLRINTEEAAKLEAADKRNSSEYRSWEQARIASKRKLDEVDRQMGMRALELERARVEADAELKRSQLRAELAHKVEIVDAKIRGKEDEIQIERRYTPENIQALKDLYAERLRILNEGVDAEAAILRKQAEMAVKLSTAKGDDVQLARDQAGLDKVTSDADAEKAENTGDAGAKTDGAISRAIRLDVEQFRRRATQIGDVWRNTVQGMIQGTMTWRDAILNVERGLLNAGLRMGQQWLTNFLARKRAEVLASQAADQSKVLSEKGAAVAKGQISLKSSLGTLFNDAKSAAGAAYKAVVGIPIVGPVLAPAAGAAAFAGVMAMSTGLTAFSAERGAASVPYDNAPFLLHKEEMVLPADLSRPLRAMLRGGGAGGGSNTTNTQNNGGDTFNINNSRARMSDDDIVSAILRAKKRGKLRGKDFGFA